MELKDVVMKLVDEISPVGETYTDEKRLDNLKVLCSLIYDLVIEIDWERRKKSRYRTRRIDESLSKYRRYAKE